MRMLGAVRQGDGQVALITGPAGIGKTRLAEEIVGRARRRRARVAIGRCWHDGEAPPLWPWVSILRQLGAPDDLLAERVGAAVRGRFARFLAVLEYLRASPGEAPFVIVVDDVHQADSATLLLARFLARERHGLPLLLMLTRRDQKPERDPEVQELLGELEREAVAIALTPLSEDAVGSYLSASGVSAPDPGSPTATRCTCAASPCRASWARAASGGASSTPCGGSWSSSTGTTGGWSGWPQSSDPRCPCTSSRAWRTRRRPAPRRRWSAPRGSR
jgi:predicted ATPase